MNTDFDYTYLLTTYRTLWHNRQLKTNENVEDTLKEAIRRELLDENAHPRVRKSYHEKFYLAMKRIMDSRLSEMEKQSLILIHLVEMEKLKSE